jgi:hypothetical protein
MPLRREREHRLHSSLLTPHSSLLAPILALPTESAATRVGEAAGDVGFTDEGLVMADFYLLPPRPSVGEELARLIRPYVPGVRVTAADCVRFLEAAVERAGGRAILVHREDLPDADDPCMSLRDGFGAGAGDRVIHVATGSRAGEPRVRVLLLSEEPVAVG